MERVHNIFDYYNISRERNDEDKVIYESNRYYGANYVLKRYTGYNDPIEAFVEHGLYMLDDGPIEQYRQLTTKLILVPSWQRAKFLREKIKDIVCIPIGPLIHYSKGIYGDYAVSATKKELGKTLLIYPLHNVENMQYDSERDEFIDFVKQVKEKERLDTVLVSIYFIDLERGAHFAYEKAGWKVVSAGRRLNYDFLDCSRTLIDISDHIIAQGFTSALCYSAFLDKPCTMIRGNLNGDFQGVRDKGIVGPMGKMSEFETMFAPYKDSVSNEQKEFCKYWAGFDCVRTPNELKLIFDFCKCMALRNNRTEEIRDIISESKYACIRDVLNQAISI